MTQKVSISKGMRSFCEAMNNLLYASVHMDYQTGVSTKYNGSARVYDGEKWVDLCSIEGNDRAIIANKVMIYIINQLNAIAMEKNGLSFTSVYNKNPQIIQRLVSEGVLIQNKTEYIVSNTNEAIGFAKINYLLDLLGYTVRTSFDCYVFGRILP